MSEGETSDRAQFVHGDDRLGLDSREHSFGAREKASERDRASKSKRERKSERVRERERTMSERSVSRDWSAASFRERGIWEHMQAKKSKLFRESVLVITFRVLVQTFHPGNQKIAPVKICKF